MLRYISSCGWRSCSQCQLCLVLHLGPNEFVSPCQRLLAWFACHVGRRRGAACQATAGRTWRQVSREPPALGGTANGCCPTHYGRVLYGPCTTAGAGGCAAAAAAAAKQAASAGQAADGRAAEGGSGAVPRSFRCWISGARGSVGRSMRAACRR